jgi:hypothetical protein
MAETSGSDGYDTATYSSDFTDSYDYSKPPPIKKHITYTHVHTVPETLNYMSRFYHIVQAIRSSLKPGDALPRINYAQQLLEYIESTYPLARSQAKTRAALKDLMLKIMHGDSVPSIVRVEHHSLSVNAKEDYEFLYRIYTYKNEVNIDAELSKLGYTTPEIQRRWNEEYAKFVPPKRFPDDFLEKDGGKTKRKKRKRKTKKY